MTNAPDANMRKALEAALGKIEKDHGKGAVMVGENYQMKVAEVVPTGALNLDIALGVGGMPRGRIAEIYGPESSGKTTFCYSVIAEAQARGGICAFIDTEHALDPIYAKNLGVDMENLIISQPDNAEQALNIADTLIESKALAVVVVDSVAALVPKAELQGEVGDSFVGLQARLMGQALRRLAGATNRSNTLLIFTNQLREKVGVMFGSPETTPGGRALKFYSSIRLDIRRIETIKEGTDAVANRVRIKIVKNKVASPFKQAEFEIRYGSGFDKFGIILDMAVENKILTKSGAFFDMKGSGHEGKIQGRANARNFLVEHPEYAQDLYNQVYEIAFPKEAVAVAPDDKVDVPGV